LKKDSDYYRFSDKTEYRTCGKTKAKRGSDQNFLGVSIFIAFGYFFLPV